MDADGSPSADLGADALTPPTVTELEMECALLRSLSSARPVGRHKHFILLQLQSNIHRHTGIWISPPDLWEKLEALYNLEALEDMASPTSSPVSLPASPKLLSPLPSKARRLHRQCESRSSNSSASPPPAPTASRSAGIINSAHFVRSFALPVVGLDESDQDEAEKWSETIYSRAHGMQEDSWPTEEEVLQPGDGADKKTEEPKKRRGRPKGSGRGRGRPSRGESRRESGLSRVSRGRGKKDRSSSLSSEAEDKEAEDSRAASASVAEKEEGKEKGGLGGTQLTRAKRKRESGSTAALASEAGDDNDGDGGTKNATRSRKKR